ncbi:MAG: CHAT domain-containing protein [Gammaproteobacteria bacterium]|nr:CHAT domain-containing protein [Gammaproteobacteria bacterium]
MYLQQKVRFRYYQISLLFIALFSYDINVFANDTYEYSTRLLQKGEYQKVIDLIEPVVYGELASKSELPAMLRRLGEAHGALGNQRKAFDSLGSALKAAESADDRAEAARIMSILGAMYSHAGVYEKAITILVQSVEAAESLQRDDIALPAKNNLANVYARLTEYDKARELYEDVFATASADGQYGLAGKALINQARTAIKQQQTRDARSILLQLPAITGRITNSQEKAFVMLSAGRLHAEMSENSADKDSALAYQLLGDALKIAKAEDNSRLISFALGYLGNLYEKAGKHEDALKLTRNALAHAQKLNANELSYRWLWQVGRLHKARNNNQLAISAYRQAIESLRPIQHRLILSSALGDSFREHVGPVYLELVDILLKEANIYSVVEKRQNTLREALLVMEAFKNAELEDYFQDDCVARMNERTKGIDSLDSKTAALYPIILENKVSMLISLSNWIQLVPIEADTAEFAEEIRLFRSKLEKRTTRQYLRHAKTLYNWMIRPIETYLAEDQIETLVVVPDGILRTIPFSALHDGKQFLIEKYAIATTPGLTLTDPQPMNPDKTQILASGITEAVLDFPALPFVSEEIQNITDLHQSRTLMNQAFTVSNIDKALASRPFNVIHIASHGEFNRKSSDSFLLAYNEKLTLNNLERYVAESRMRNAPVELLTLSACQTAAGDERAALGLAGVALKAGARTAVASLWFVSDEASSALISNFYSHVGKRDHSKAKALQLAQTSLLRDEKFQHPSYWAPFLVIGNWL